MACLLAQDALQKYGGGVHNSANSDDLKELMLAGVDLAPDVSHYLMPYRKYSSATRIHHILAIGNSCLCHRHKITPLCKVLVDYFIDEAREPLDSAGT